MKVTTELLAKYDARIATQAKVIRGDDLPVEVEKALHTLEQELDVEMCEAMVAVLEKRGLRPVSMTRVDGNITVPIGKEWDA